MARFSVPRIAFPKVLDADDARMLAHLIVLSLLVIWVVWLIALTLGIGMRLFQWAAFGG